MAEQDLPAHSLAVPWRRARALFCTECRQLSKYRTVTSYGWLFPFSTLSLDARLPCVKRLIRYPSVVDEINALQHQYPAVDDSIRSLDVNS